MTNYQRVYQTVADHMAMTVGELHPEQSLKDDLGMDSLDHVEIVMALEDEFDIEIDDEAGGALCTIADLTNYIDKVTS